MTYQALHDVQVVCVSLDRQFGNFHCTIPSSTDPQRISIGHETSRALPHRCSIFVEFHRNACSDLEPRTVHFAITGLTVDSGALKVVVRTKKRSEAFPTGFLSVRTFPRMTSDVPVLILASQGTVETLVTSAKKTIIDTFWLNMSTREASSLIRWSRTIVDMLTFPPMVQSIGVVAVPSSASGRSAGSGCVSWP